MQRQCNRKKIEVQKIANQELVTNKFIEKWQGKYHKYQRSHNGNEMRETRFRKKLHDQGAAAGADHFLDAYLLRPFQRL